MAPEADRAPGRTTIGLLGGEEFTPAASAFDQQLLAFAPGGPPGVAIVPTAAALENADLAAANGVAHFRRLGADAYGVMAVDRRSANDPRVADDLRRAGLIYLTGGDPPYLLSTLKDSLALSRIEELARRGVAVAGSSAGAMALCARVRYGGTTLDGFGLGPEVVVLPHFERRSDDDARSLQAGLAPDEPILALDGATGCYSDGGAWTVAGPGRVRVISRAGVAAFSQGDTFALP